MNTRLKIALLMLSFIGAWGLTLTIKSGYAGSRLACQLVQHDRSWFIKSAMGLAKSITTG